MSDTKTVPVPTGTVESPTTTELYKALFTVQCKLNGVAADSTNSDTASRYASLHAVMRELRPFLQEAKLLVMHSVLNNEDFSRIGVTQKVIHVESGEYIADTYWLPVVNNHPQAHAMVMTYLGRYLLKTRFLVTFKEDDADGVIQGVNAPDLSVAANQAASAAAPAVPQAALAVPETVSWTNPLSGKVFEVSKLCHRQLDRIPSLPLESLNVAAADAKLRLVGDDLDAFLSAIDVATKHFEDSPQEIPPSNVGPSATATAVPTASAMPNFVM